MPESPDFDQIARDMVDSHTTPNPARAREFAQRLRAIWNARGAADIARLEIDLNGETFTGDLTRALRTLDR